MAEYYPLLSRAVAGLRDAPPAQRLAIYDRARQALLGQLRSMQPPVPEDAIERESVALDASIDRLEREIAKTSRSGPSGPPAPEVAVEKAAEPAPASPTPVAQPAAPALPGPGTESAVSPAPVAAPVKPTPARMTIRPSAPATAIRPPAPLARPGPSRPSFEPRTTAVPAPPPLRATRGDEQPAATALPSAPRLQVAPVAKEVADQEPGTAAETVATDLEPAALSPDEAAVATREEVLRPAAPRPVPREPFNPRLIIVVAVAALVIAGISYAAWRLRDKPEAIARSRAAMLAAQQADQQPGKVVTRADVGAAVPPVVAQSTTAADAVATAETASPAAPPPPTQVLPTVAAPDAAAPQGTAPPVAPPTETTAATPAVTAPAGSVSNTADLQVVPVAQRAALLVDAPDDPKKVKTYVGTVIWRSESVSPGQGQPLAEAVRAELEVPDAGLKLSMLFQKNAEPQFPASHTIELRFTTLASNTLGNVKQINVPQMRQDDSPTGDPLVGLPVTITENYFLVGLSRGDAMAHNLDLIKSRNWIDIPILLVSGKVAKITFEKGTVGQQVIDNAIQSWQ